MIGTSWRRVKYSPITSEMRGVFNSWNLNILSIQACLVKYFYFKFQMTFPRCQFLYSISSQLLTGQIPKWELGCWHSVQITVSWQPKMVSSYCPILKGKPTHCLWCVFIKETRTIIGQLFCTMRRLVALFKISSPLCKRVTTEEIQPMSSSIRKVLWAARTAYQCINSVVALHLMKIVCFLYFIKCMRAHCIRKWNTQIFPPPFTASVSWKAELFTTCSGGGFWLPQIVKVMELTFNLSLRWSWKAVYVSMQKLWFGCKTHQQQHNWIIW